MADLRATKRSKGEMSGADRLLHLSDHGVLEHSGKRFAVGLLWLTTEEPNSAFASQKALMDARRALIQPDFVCDRSVIISQQGYGHLAKGHRMGMPVAAAAAADLLVGEWHGVFKADNGWWYVAVHGDAIAPDGDVFFHSEEDAYKHFMAAMDAQRWPRAYAPKDWSIAGTNHDIDLEKLLSGLPTTYLKPFTLDGIFGDPKNKYLFFIVSGFVLFLLGTFMTTGLGQYMQSPPQPLRQFNNLDVAPSVVPPPRYMSSDFVDTSKLLETEDFPPPVLIRACLGYFEDMFRPLPGWQLTALKCGGGSVTGQWTRGAARLADMGKLRNYFSGAATMTYDGREILEVNDPLVLDKIEKVKMQVLRKDILYALITQRLESKGTLSIQEVELPPPPPEIGPNGQPLPPAAPERVLSITFTTPMAAYLWADDFDIPAMKPLELKWSIPDSTWTMTGTVKYQ